MKLLLLTDIPPCSNLTAGIVLAQLCRFLPRDAVVCFTVLNRHLQPVPCPDLDWLTIKQVQKPNEFGLPISGARRLPEPFRATMAANFCRWFKIPKIREQAVAFGQAHKVDAVWAVLQGQTMVHLSLPVADRLQVPLYTQMWDPLSWWLRDHRVDPWNAHVARRDFRRTLRASRACAAASWHMAAEYERRFGVRSVPVIASLDASLAVAPRLTLRGTGEVVIGMAGQFYASHEWHVLLHALNLANWQVCGRPVRLKVVGYSPPDGTPSDRVEYLGWQSQPDAIRILSEQTDILYCPYPFAEPMREVAEMSFPSKLPLYFATGRPVLFHGPRWSSPSVYLAKRSAAALATELETTSVYNEIQRLVMEPELYRQVASAGRAAFFADFTLDVMRSRFFEFLGAGTGFPE